VGGKISHGGNPVLRWNAANLVAVRDENNNEKPSKKRSADKIDGMCALLMALGVAMAKPEPTEPEYQMLFL
jgi:phage terminase large subunit-like protein